ncbi:MAG: 4a-hydroxytetrahydrobiopterin dehydratase [Beijerinckiaceae bacterium]
MTRAKNWTDTGDSLTRSLTFATFAQAMQFMAEVAVYCDKADHHPDWRNVYNRIDIVLTTHDANGVTGKDVALAAHMNAVFMRLTG